MSTLFVFSSVSFADPNIAPDTNSADCDNSTLTTYSGTSNLTADWEANTINLHWYNGNTEITVPSESQTCTYDGALIPPPPLEREGYTFAGWKVRDLPYGYTKLEYIHFCTTCKFNTQKRIGAAFEIYGTIMYSSGTQSYRNILYSTLNTNSFVDFQVGWFGNTLLNSTISNDSGSGGIGTPGPNKKFTFGISPEWLQNYKGTRSTLRRPYTGNGYLIVVGGGSNNTVSMHVYNVKMYNNGNLDLNLIPAQRNSDNVLGMWDTVSKTFYINAGSGSFTAGPLAQ